MYHVVNMVYMYYILDALFALPIGLRVKYLDYLHYLYAYLYNYIVDEIYHLASPASPVKYMYNPIKTIKTNTIGTLNMLGKTMYMYVCKCTSNRNIHRRIKTNIGRHQ